MRFHRAVPARLAKRNSLIAVDENGNCITGGLHENTKLAVLLVTDKHVAFRLQSRTVAIDRHT
jgi:hypothetical protein